jgi:hypothetical protein
MDSATVKACDTKGFYPLWIDGGFAEVWRSVAAGCGQQSSPGGHSDGGWHAFNAMLPSWTVSAGENNKQGKTHAHARSHQEKSPHIQEFLGYIRK